ncbi:MAG: CDC48 family AAA ATPase [Tepidisphaeraceae bacterium]|jgi:transitional endoplasmic reticulum ATPase
MAGGQDQAVLLKVSEALSKDVGRAMARIDPDDLRRLGVQTGDVVLISGQRQAVCRAMPALKEARGQSRVQLDGITRQNLGSAIDESVRVTKTACSPAQVVKLTPVSVKPDERDLAYIAGLLDGLPVLPGGMIRLSLFGARNAEFTVASAQPAGPLLINPTTRLQIGEVSGNQPAQRLGYEDVGGLKPQLGRIRELIELPLRHPEVFARLGIDPPKGVLLHGPPGCGKTLIARIIAQESSANFYSISGPEIIHKFYGESEAHLRKIFDEASRHGPAIIFLDEIDSIAPKRENTVGDVEKRVVAQLLALMDGLNQRQNLIVIAATNLPNNLDPALRRPGRFDREIYIPIPDRNGRRHILDIHSRGMPLAQDVNLDRLADVTHGYVGADLQALCREAAMACLRKLLGDVDLSRGGIPSDRLQTLEVTQEHFLSALAEIEPSAMREVFVEVPSVTWDDIGGLADVKRQLTEAVEWPLKHADLFAKAAVRPAKGLLLSGPPGVGKTLLAKAAATQSNANFISVKGPELMGRYVGESEKAVRDVFRKARHAAPCVIFFDEIDALLPHRGSDSSVVGDRVIAQFLAEMDGVEELRGVLVMGATNRLDLIDPAVLRPGRFDLLLKLPLPDLSARREIFQVHLRGKPLAKDIDCAELARRTDGASAADIAGACTRAALAAVRRVITSPAEPLLITPDDLLLAIAQIKNHADERKP